MEQAPNFLANKLENLNDLAIAKAIAEGDNLAFEEVYKKNYQRIYSLCLKMMKGNTYDADDRIQETFIQLIKHAKDFKGESTLGTWLYQIGINQCLMHFRKIKNDKNDKTTEFDETFMSKKISDEDNKKKLEVDLKIIEKLPAGYKEVFILHDIEGHTHEQIAKILGCAVGTSKAQLHKARFKLQELLENSNVKISIKEKEKILAKLEKDFSQYWEKRKNEKLASLEEKFSKHWEQSETKSDI